MSRLGLLGFEVSTTLSSHHFLVTMVFINSVNGSDPSFMQSSMEQVFLVNDFDPSLMQSSMEQFYLVKRYRSSSFESPQPIRQQVKEGTVDMIFIRTVTDLVRQFRPYFLTHKTQQALR
jgi:hypothetical protein